MANKRYANLYKRLVALYPAAFRDRFGESIEQTFDDLCRERQQAGKGLFAFVLFAFFETGTGIVREHIAEGGIMKNIISNPSAAALIGLLFTLPFLVLNTIVGNQIEPFLTFIRPTGHTSNFEYFLLAIVLLLLPIGALVVANPMLQKRKFFAVNTVLVLIMLAGFVAISVGLGSDIYRCDVLQIPNCD